MSSVYQKYKINPKLQKVISLLMVLVMVFNIVTPLAAKAEEPEETPEDGGFSVSLKWNGNVTDSSNYDYNSSTDETREVRLNVSYKNDSLLTDYKAGQIVITVPGINDANRNGLIAPVAIAADRAEVADKIYDWSYTYNSSTNMYTFTNNSSSDKHNVYEGMFEIVWRINSIYSKHGYSKNLQATLRTANGEETESNVITYSQERDKYVYTLREQSQTFNPISMVYSSAGLGCLIDEGKTENDYRFVKYSGFSCSSQSKARLLINSSKYDSYITAGWNVWVIEGANLCGTDGKMGEGASFQKTDIKEVINGFTYVCWTTHSKTVSIGGTSGSLEFCVAYPKDIEYPVTAECPEGEACIYLEGKGRYCDEDHSEIVAARTPYSIDVSSIHYISMGDAYGLSVYNYGLRNDYTRYHDNFSCWDCRYYGAVNAVNVKDGKGDYCSYLYFSYYKEDKCSFEIGDDVFQVCTTSSNTYRILEDDEYNITKITIPSIQNLKNVNGFTIEPKTYAAKIYVREAGNDNFVLYKDDALLDSIDHTYTFESSNIVGVSVVLVDIDQSIQRLHFKIDYKFHSDRNDIVLDHGYFKNFVFARDVDPNVEYQQRTDYKTLSNENYLRTLDSTHILIIPNTISEYVSISTSANTSTQYNFTGSIQDTFAVATGNSLNAFTVYAIIPDGLSIQDRYNTKEKLLDYLSITGLDKSSSYLKSHASLSIKEKTDASGKKRTYIEIKFNFSDAPFVNTENSSKYYYLSINRIPMTANIDEVNQRSTGNMNPKTFYYTFRAITTIDQDDFWFVKYDYKDNQSFENGIWADIDGDGDTNETVGYYSSSVSFTVAGYAQLESVMSVNTVLSNGYVKPNYDSDTGEFTNVPETYGSHVYSYRIKFRGSRNTVGNIVFVDALEKDPLISSGWKGTFAGIDTAKAAEFTKVQPKVYYCEDEEVDTSDLPDFTDAVKWKELPADISGWTKEELSKVKTLAVDFQNAVLVEAQYVYFDIYMTAPDNPGGSLSYDRTVNTCAVNYTPINDLTNETGEHTLRYTNKTAVYMAPFKGTVKIEKKDSVDNTELSGALFDLYKTDGDLLIQEDLTGGDSVTDVEYGEYYLIETKAPKGYILPDEPKYSFTLEANVPDAVANVTILNTRMETSVTLKKVSDKDSSKYLKGAEFRLHKENGDYYNDTVYKSNNDGLLKLTGIPWGSYYLEETKAPSGYEITESAKKVSFTVNADNNAGRELSLNIVNNQLPGRVILQKYEKLEDGTETTNPLSNAFYELYSSDDKLLGTYLTDSSGIIQVDNLNFGNYYFKETVPSTGYTVNPDRIEFTIEGSDPIEDGIVVHRITTYDTHRLGSVWLEKKDDQGEYVKGAVYALFRQSDNKRVNTHGEVIENSLSEEGCFTTDDLGSFTVGDIWWGEYYLKEISSPSGYQLNTATYPFTIDKNSVRSVIKIQAQDNRLKGKVQLIKVNSENPENKLPDAQYGLYSSDGAWIKSVTTGLDGTVLINDIPWGSYYLQEEKAPVGFGLSDEKIRFSVNYISAGKTQEITAEDKPARGEVSVKKVIPIDSIVFSHGEPMFIFMLRGHDDVGNTDYTVYKSVTFSKDYVKSMKEAGKQNAEMTLVFSDIPTGTCTLSEIETIRYAVSQISDVSVNGVVNNTDKKIVFTITDSNLKCSATFTNAKEVQSKASQTTAEVNILKKARKVTSLSAIWKGDRVYTDTMLDRSKLDVYVIYDDGVTKKLADDEYELWNGTQQLSQPGVDDFELNTNLTATIDVKYTYSGRTYTDQFEIRIVSMAPFTYTVTEAPFTENGIQYAGTALITGYVGSGTNASIPSKVTGKRTLLNNVTGEYQDEPSDKVYKVVGTESITGNTACYGFSNFTNLTLPDSVKEIGKYSFYYCASLESINLDNVETIGDNAFRGCSVLNNLDLTDIASIGTYAFCKCSSLSDLTVGDGITKVGAYAFQDTTFDTGERGGNDNGLYGAFYVTDKILTGRNSYSSPSPYPDKFKKLVINSGTICIGDRTFSSHLYTEVDFPDTLKGIGIYAFAHCQNLSSIEIPSSVTYIGSNAFYNCRGLTNVTIPNTLTNLGESVFESCVGLTDVLIEHGVSSIPKRTFSSCTGLTSITIPDSVTSIGDNAFYGCTGLTSITIPDSVTSIGDRAFYNCKGITNVTIPNTLTNLGEYVFQSCTGLTDVLIEDGVTSIPKGTFSDCTGLTSITIPDSVTSIGEKAFYRCTGLTSIIIPDSVTSIEDYAFQSCTGLTSITIPDGVTSINNYTFYGCTGLTSITIPDSVTSIGNYAFYGCTGLTSITIPDSVTSIGKYAFYNCTGLTGITIPDSVTSIGDDAFIRCTGLTSITIPDSVTSIGNGVFSQCTGLTSITIPDSVTSIGNSAFYLCTGLTSITIPDSVTSIGNYAFSDCTGLTSITIPDSVTSIGDFAFCGCTGLTSITIPDSVTSIGKDAFKGCTGLTSITIPEGVTSIGNEAFYGCTGLTSITLPDSVTSIGDYAFQNCTGLTSFTISESVESIGWGAFNGCTGLTSITIPASVTSIGAGAFSSCTNMVSISVAEGNENFTVVDNSLYSKDLSCMLTYLASNKDESFTIPDFVTRIEGAFWGCTELKNITIPDNVTFIGNCAFTGCTGLTSITIPDGVTDIAYKAFSGCTGLTSIVIPDGVTFIGSAAFRDCTGLTDITIPDSVTDIGTYAFAGCTELTSIDLSESLTVLKECLFAGCESLTSVTIPDGVTKIDSAVFVVCKNLKRVSIPNSVTDFGSGVFYGCESLTDIEIGKLLEIRPLYSIVEENIINITNVEIAEGVTELRGDSFYYCEGLTSIKIPNSLTSLNNVRNALAPCTSLKSIEIGKLLETRRLNQIISNSTVLQNITDITVADGTATLVGSAFNGCTGLTSVKIPNSVTAVGSGVFSGCNSLKKVEVGTLLETKTLQGILGNSTVSGGVTDVTVNEGTTKLVDGAFANCAGLTNITIPDSVTSIGRSAFQSCTGLTSITIPGSVTSIGNAAFNRCTGLTGITIPDSVTTLGNGVFQNCTGLTSVKIPNSVTALGSSVFSGCTSLRSIEIGTMLQTKTLQAILGSAAILKNITNVTIADGTTQLVNGAFASCTGLTSITIPDSVTSIGTNVLNGVTIDGNLIIPQSVTTLQTTTFSNMTITNGKVYLPSHLTDTYGLTESNIVRYSDPSELP